MTQFRLALALTALLSILGAYVWGRTDSTTLCKAGALAAYQEGIQKNAKIDRTVSRMAEPALDRALANWLQNDQ